MTGTYYQSHAQFERDHPEIAEYERVIHDRRVTNGLEPAREFPCAGSLRHADEHALRPIVICDQCGYETTVPAAQDREPVEVSKGAFL